MEPNHKTPKCQVCGRDMEFIEVEYFGGTAVTSPGPTMDSDISHQSYRYKCPVCPNRIFETEEPPISFPKQD